MTAREVLDGVKGRLAAITPGPWRTGPAQQPKFAAVESHIYSPRGSHILLGPTDGNAGQAKNADAVFIASAPSTVARLTAAVESVLDVAETLETYTKNTRNNNHNLDREWEARASGYEAAVTLLRAAIENALKEGQ